MSAEDAVEQDIELVGSGTFKVDRERALDKLMRFQLPEAGMFVLPLLRCAAASGATRVRILTSRGPGLGRSRFELRFDGRPFTREELSDPYSVLFEKRTAQTARNRELAVALLTALRLKQDLLAVTSGSGPARVRLEVESIKAEKASPVQDGGVQTLFELHRGELVGSFDDVTAMVRRSCAASRMSVMVDGSEVVSVPPLDPDTSLFFEEGGTRAWLTVPRSLEDSSFLRVSTWGVEVGTLTHQLSRVQVEGLVNDDGLALNVSQTGVARSGRFKTVMEAVAEQSEKLLLKVLEGSPERLSKAAALIKKKGPDAWLSGLDRGRVSGGPSLLALMGKAVQWLSSDQGGEREALRSMGEVTAWLLEACERNLSDPAKDAKTPLLKALWRAPLLLGSKGEALSLQDLASLRARMGFVPFSTRLGPDDHPFPAAWAASGRVSRLLRKLFPEAWKDVTSTVWKVGVEVDAAVDVKAEVKVLRPMGFDSLLIRDSFAFKGFSIEVGIPASPEGDTARIYLWEEAGPRLLDMAPRMKFAAAILKPSGPPDAMVDADLASAVAAAAECAESLYKRLAKEYDCWKTDTRQVIIRAVLLDVLETAVEDAGGSLLPEARSWLRDALLFRTDSGWTDHAKLCAWLEEGRVVCAAPSLQSVGSLRPERFVIGAEYTKRQFAAVLPEAGFLDAEGLEAVRFLFKRSPAVSCEHTSPLGCLIEVEPLSLHLTPGEVDGGRVLRLAWGTVTAFGSQTGRQDLEAKLSRRFDLAGRLACGLIERHGTMWRRPEHSARRFLLRAVPAIFSPWPGIPEPGSAAGIFNAAAPDVFRRLQGLLGLLPFFQSGGPTGITLGHLGVLLVSADRVTFGQHASGSAELFADLIVDQAELEAVHRLWPGRADRLTEVGAPEKPESESREQASCLEAPASIIPQTD
ncbi:MAG: hypothetical protein WC943_16325, partial [Elusimicrobiota bacterium]